MKWRKSGGITIVVTLALLVFLLGLLGILLINAAQLNKYIKENVSVTVFFDSGLSERESKIIADSIGQLDYVLEGSYTSAEEAVFNFKNEIGEDFVEILGDNPLPASIELVVNSNLTEESELESLENQLMQIEGVLEVSYPKDVFYQIDKNRRVISFWLLVISIILIVIAVVLISNTVKLLVYSDRFIIKTQQLIGARESFILKPYRKTAIIWTLLSFVLGIIVLVAVISTVFSWLNISMDINLSAIKQHFFNNWHLYVLMLFLLLDGSLVIVYLASSISTKKYLKNNIETLYN